MKDGGGGAETVDHHKTLVSVKLLDQLRVVTELVGPQFNLMDFKDAEVKEGPEVVPLRKR